MVLRWQTVSRWIPVAFLILAFLCLPTLVQGDGALLYKSGPIQITSDGATVWAVNPDHDSVSYFDTATETVSVVDLPAGTHNPQGLAIRPDNTEVWVACHDSGTVYVLDAVDGDLLETLELHPGSGPFSVAFDPAGDTAWVTLHRSDEIAVFDTDTYEIDQVITNLYRHPMGIAFSEDGTQAWITHTIMDGEDSYTTGIEVATYNVLARVIFKSVNPKSTSQISGDADPIPEGGYLLPHGHMAQVPGTDEMWAPVQYQNFHNPDFTSESSIQAAIHKIDLTTASQDQAGRFVLTAVYAHDNVTFLDDGWDAKISGPIDLGFSDDGGTAYLVNSYSNDVLVFHTDIGKERGSAAALVEIDVGDRPLGIALSPTDSNAYVLNHLSRDVSVIDLDDESVSSTVDLVPGVTEPLDDEILAGAKLFFSSVDSRINDNQKVACASCHINGEGEGLAWDFASLGAGQRKTFTLRGLAYSFGEPIDGKGQLHRSGDRDEVQDFDFTFRGGLMGGTGFLDTPNAALGADNAGIDTDLDALAAFVLDLPAVAISPHRDSDGDLTPAAVRGGLIFQGEGGTAYGAGCNDCHTAPNFTDLDFHDVNGFAPSPENEGPEFNTPSLVGAWDLGPYTQAIGWDDGHTLGGLVRNALDGDHGDTSGLTESQMRDLEEFLKSIDGALAESGIDDLEDTDPPRVLAVLPVTLTELEIVFDETVDSITAADPDNYQFTDGTSTVTATDAVVSVSAGNRVRVTAPLEYAGCDVTYTFLPGPIEDVASGYGAAANNVLDTADTDNQLDVVLDGTITVTFGNAGVQTFSSVAEESCFNPGLSNVSHDHWRLYPFTNPPMKGFIQFDFVDILTDECGLTDSGEILEASFAALPHYGNLQTLELQRCLKPWNAPYRDWCFSCPSTLTRNHATRTSVAWTTNGARSIGTDGDDPDDYYPIGNNDVAAQVDCEVTVETMNDWVTFSDPLVTEAFQFWFDNSDLNYGYCVEVPEDNGTGIEFYSTRYNDGVNGAVLSITFSVEPNASDCSNEAEFIRGDIDEDTAVDITDVFDLLDFLFAGLPISCEESADVTGNDSLDIGDPVYLLSYIYLDGAQPPAPFPDCASTVLSFSCESHAACP